MDNCKLNLFLQKITRYEIGLIKKIKWFLHPRQNEYKFKLHDIVKYIYYEMSFHNHLNCDYSNYMKNNVYCECYYNRKHRRLNELKKHKCVKLMKILALKYDENNYQKIYKCGYGFEFKIECDKTEDELIHISV